MIDQFEGVFFDVLVLILFDFFSTSLIRHLVATSQQADLGFVGFYVLVADRDLTTWDGQGTTQIESGQLHISAQLNQLVDLIFRRLFWRTGRFVKVVADHLATGVIFSCEVKISD